MSAECLKQLSVNNLRGSTQPFTLSFENRKKLSIIYGENGTGKSTICDAFEFLGKGKIGSLDNRGLGKTNKYWTSLGKQPKDVSVSLETSKITYSGIINRSNVIINPSDVLRVEVLRRNQILSLVEAKAGERYNAISRFIDVSGVENAESELRTLIRGIEGDRREAIARIDENKMAIDNHWETANKPGKDSMVWAESEVKKDRTVFDVEINYLSNLQSAYNRLKEYPKQVKDIDKKIDEKKKLVVDAQNRIDDISSKISSNASEIVEILEAAKSYLDKIPKPKICPLCESAENVTNLKTRVIERMSDFTVLQIAQKDKKNAAQELQNLETQRQSVQNTFESHHKKLVDLLQQKDIPKGVELPKESVPINCIKLATWFDNTNLYLEKWRNAEKEKLGIKQSLETLEKSLENYKNNFRKQKELDVLLPKLQKTLEIVQEERRKFTDQILSQIAIDVGRIYEVVHPGEGLNKISMQLDPAQRASLNIGANFCGQDTPPQAYFSESHLDTLGLCIFLSLSSLDKPEETILVLDDVLASVDEPHVDRLIEMLYEEAMKFQHCVITTHYRPWKQKFRWGWLKNGQCQFTELSKWTNEEGMTLIRSIPDMDRLRDLLSEVSPDPQLVCAKAGVILEAILDFLTLLYECAVPRKPENQYTLGDLLPSINKKLRKALKVEILISQDGNSQYEEQELGPILDELRRIAQLRNVFGCHFNTLSHELLEDDAIAFGENVLSLVDALIDTEAGWPKNCKSGSYWATAGETRRLHPLKKPE